MAQNLEIDEKRKDILNAEGHLLIEGGPGSGKTTIALLKAKRLIVDLQIGQNQKILFLSFARATIGRVEEQAASLITSAEKRKIEVNTYHGFCWAVIKSYGCHLVPHKSFQLITPPNFSALISSVPESDRDEFKQSLFLQKGQMCFDLFAKVTSDIFEQSAKITSIFSQAYPFIIVDEFQDTDENEWNLIKLLGKGSSIIALADLQQRIFEFRGASVTRIPEFNQFFLPIKFDLGKENNRSATRDIATFGDDILSGANKGKNYKDVAITSYPANRSDPKASLRYSVLTSLARLKKSNGLSKWSLAILVKTKSETLQLSSYLLTHKIYHEVIIDPAGPALSASMIAKLLEPIQNDENLVFVAIDYLVNHIKGRKGDKLPVADSQVCKFLEQYVKNQKINGVKQKQLIEEIKSIVVQRKAMVFNGVPEDDWIRIRHLFQNCLHPSLKNVYEDAKYLRLLNKGAVLSEKLSQTWRQNQSYFQAVQAIDDALTQEHFAMTNRQYSGVYIMNIHKSKGKEFDEVIIWEDPFRSLVYKNTNPSVQDRILLRVAATRSKSRTTILTPKSNPCILL